MYFLWSARCVHAPLPDTFARVCVSMRACCVNALDHFRVCVNISLKVLCEGVRCECMRVTSLCERANGLHARVLMRDVWRLTLRVRLSYSILRVSMLFVRAQMCDVCVCVCVAMRHCVREPLVWNMLDASFCLRAHDPVLARNRSRKKKKWSAEGIEPSTHRLKSQRSPTSPRGGTCHNTLQNPTSLASPNKTHSHTFTQHHHSRTQITLAQSILALSYYFPSQTSTFRPRFLRPKMNGSERSRGVHLCFRPCPTRWSGRIRYTLHRYTRSGHHWRACFLATQAPHPTGGPLSSCTKLPGGTTRLFALVAHAYCQWLAHNNFSPFRAIAILRTDFAKRPRSAALFSFPRTQFCSPVVLPCRKTLVSVA